MRNKIDLMFIGILVCIFLISFTSAITINTTSYSVNSTHLGSSGSGNITTSNFIARDTITYQQTGTRNVQTTSYTANSGWFVVAAQEVGSVNITEIFFSNESAFNYSNAFNSTNITYDMNLTYVGVNCTALSGSVSNVTFSLFNTEDNTTYVNETGYDWKNGNLYIWNASYQIRDSGNWTLNVTCSASGGGNVGRDASLWEIAWGIIQINLIDPISTTLVQIYQFFTFSANVTCSGGECGFVNVTLDPYEVINETCGRLTTCENVSIGEVCVNETIPDCGEECSIVSEEVCENITIECTPDCDDVCVEYEDVNGTQGDCLNYETQCQSCEDEITQNCTTEEKQVCVDINCTENIVEKCTEVVEENCTIEIVCEDVREGGDSGGSGNETSNETEMPGEEFSEGEILETEKGKDLGEKTEDEAEYETHFLSMEQGDEEFRVVFYHDFNGTLPVSVVGSINYTLDIDEADYLENITLVVDLIEGILPQFELHIGEESEVFTFGKVIPVVELKEGNYTLIDRDDLKLDVQVEFESEESILLRGVEDEPNINVTLGINLQQDVSTSIIAVHSLNIENATITLEKTKGVNAIISCDDSDFDYETLECSDWKYANVDFVEGDNTIEFNVDHFTAYAGGNLTAGETAFLTIWDYNDIAMPNASVNGNDTKVANETIQFFADYELARNGTKLSNGNCTIDFSDMNVINMTYNSSYEFFLYERNFTSNGAYPYVVNCTHASYTDLSVSDNIVIGTYSNDTKGAVSTTIGDVPFYTTSDNPQQCTLKGGETCNVGWEVNVTGILNKIYDFFVEAIGIFMPYTTSSHVNLTISANDTTIPVFVSKTIYPAAVINGSSTIINADVSDNIQVGSVWGVVTAPSGFNTSFSSVPYIFSNSSELGRYNVTYYANDSSGNNATTTKTFQVAGPANLTMNVSVEVDVTVNVSTNVDFIAYVSGTQDIIETKTNITGSESVQLPNVPVDLFFDSVFNDSNRLTTLFEINLSNNANTSITFGNPSLSDYLVTYGIETDFNFTNAQVEFYYTGISYSNEDNLKLYKCDSFVISSGACTSGFNDITSDSRTTHDEDNDKFIYNTTSFSGFGIKQYVPPYTSTEEEVSTGGGAGGCASGYELINGTCVKVEEIPTQLFDITFNLEDTLIESVEDLSGIVTFESFGTVPTPVELTFIIKDEFGKIVYIEESNITVTTEEVLRWNYETLQTLPEGKYTAILNTLYNIDVFDEFTQEFEIGEERKGITGRIIEFIETVKPGEKLWYVLVFVLSFLFIIVLWHFIKRHKKGKISMPHNRLNNKYIQKLSNNKKGKID